jgi:hypothetical protein
MSTQENNDINDETVILSQEYIYDSQQKKEQGLLDIAMVLAQKKIYNNNKEKVYKEIEEYLKSDFIKNQKFETDNLNILYEKLCKENPNLIKQSGLSIMINGDIPKKYAFSLLYIYLLKENIENKNKNINELKDDIDEFDQQIDIKNEQIDELENKLKDPKLKLRIIKLREKCIQKNSKIKILYYLISFLTFTNLIGQKNVIYLFNLMMNYIFIFSGFVFTVLKEIGIILYNDIWVDIILLFYCGIGVYLYKYNLLKFKNKKD